YRVILLQACCRRTHDAIQVWHLANAVSPCAHRPAAAWLRPVVTSHGTTVDRTPGDTLQEASLPFRGILPIPSLSEGHDSIPRDQRFPAEMYRHAPVLSPGWRDSRRGLEGPGSDATDRSILGESAALQVLENDLHRWVGLVLACGTTVSRHSGRRPRLVRTGRRLDS